MPNVEHDAEFRAWLAAAADGLCEPAQRRIEAEIRAHYTESVTAEMAEGKCEDAALLATSRRAAMTALGDAKEARKEARVAGGRTSTSNTRRVFAAICVCKTCDGRPGFFGL